MTHGIFTDQQAQRLAAALAVNQTLKKFDITHNNISDEGLNIIVPVMKSKNGFDFTVTGNTAHIPAPPPLPSPRMDFDQNPKPVLLDDPEMKTPMGKCVLIN